MDNLIIKGRKIIAGMSFYDIEGGFGESKKSMLVKDIAEIHGRELKDINRRINDNRKRFKDGIHIIDLKKLGESEAPSFESFGYNKQSVANANNIYLLSERGYAILLKILEDDVAWEKYEQLVDGYFTMRSEKLQQRTAKTNLSSVNNAVKIIGQYMKQAGISEDIQLLTVKGLYAKADVFLPIDIQADKVYYDTTQIAKRFGMKTKTNKPAYHAVNVIIRELDIFKDEVKEVWETNGSWQGVVKKYSESAIEKVEEWLKQNKFPAVIPDVNKNYYVYYESAA